MMVERKAEWKAGMMAGMKADWMVDM